MQGLLAHANDFLDRSKHEANLRLSHAAQTLPPSLIEQFSLYKESLISFIIALLAIITVFIGRFVDYTLDLLLALRRGSFFNFILSVARFVFGADRVDSLAKVFNQFLQPSARK
jgi:hypothetical protein